MTSKPSVVKDLQQKVKSLEREIERLRLLLPSSAKHTQRGSQEFWAECTERLGLSDVEYFKDLIENGKISMTDTSDDGQTLLLLAAQRGSYEVVQLCLNLGADINHIDDEGKDSLRLSRDGAWYHIEQLLLFEKMQGNVGEEVQNTAKIILKQRGFIENVMEALKVHKNKKIVMDSLVDIMIHILREKKCFSEDMLHLCWEFVSSNDNNPLESRLWKTLRDTCKDVIDNENSMWWYWLKKFVMPSTIWFEDTAKCADDDEKEEKTDEEDSNKDSSNKRTYLYYNLLELVKDKSVKQLEDHLVPQMNALREENPQAWEAIISYDIQTTLELNCRQDKVPHGLTADYDPIELAKATTSSTKFDSAGHYDYNEYLSEMVLTAYMVDDEFQESVQGIYDIDPRTSCAVDVNGDIIKYMRGPVKLMERCKAKAETDYSNEAFPTSACVLDLNRCSLVFSNLRSLLIGLKTFENKVKHYEGRAIIDIVRDKNGFIEYAKYPCYADIKLNVLVRGVHNNIIAEVQFLLQQMKDFKAKAHNLYNITRKEEFIANTSKLLPMLLDTEKSLFVHGNAGDSNGLRDLMIVSNKSAKYIMKVDEKSKESILMNMCSLGKEKALRFLQSIIPSDLFVDRMFFPNRYNSLALEPAVHNKQLLTVKILLSNPDIQARYQKSDDNIFRLLYMAMQSFDEKMWEFVTEALKIDNEKLIKLVDHQIPEPPEDAFPDGAYIYHHKSLVDGCCMGDNVACSAKLIALLGEEAFCDKMFDIDVCDVNRLELCLQSLNFVNSKFLLSLKPIALRLSADSNLLFRYLCWAVRSASDEYLEWFRNEFNLNDDACRKYMMYDQYPQPDPETYLAVNGTQKLDTDGAWTYHEKGILHWAMWSNNIKRCKWIISLVEKHNWYNYLMAADTDGWQPFAILIRIKQFEFAEYLLDNFEKEYQSDLIEQGSWMEDEKVKAQVKEWKVKYS